jgi:hypothetical protein
MDTLFASGRIADIALIVMAVEAIILRVVIAYRGDALPYRALLANLAAGACLVIAVRLALVGAHWQWIALVLAASLLAHSTDVALRLRTTR